MNKPVRAAFGIAALAVLGACGPQGGTPADDGEPMLDIGQMRAGDAAVPKTEYHATAQIECSVDGQQIDGGCMAGVVRGWGEDGSGLVEITRPDGFKRAIFVGPDGEPFGADTAEAEGSADSGFVVTHDADGVMVQLGLELYRWPHSFVLGEWP